MRALVLYEPWASLVALGLKTIETRPKTLGPYRGPVAICSSKAWDDTGGERAWDHFHLAHPDRFPCLTRALDKKGNVVWLPPKTLGHVVALVDLVDAAQFDIGSDDTHRLWPTLNGEFVDEDNAAMGVCTRGRWGLRLSNVRRLADPLPLVGKQGLWTLTEAQAAEVLERAAGRGTKLSNEHRTLVEHALGLDCYGKRRPFRAYFCAERDTLAEAICEDLTARGLMRAGHTINDGRDRYYHVTEAGAVAVGHVLPKERS